VEHCDDATWKRLEDQVRGIETRARVDGYLAVYVDARLDVLQVPEPDEE
jgi:hypothetical protein